MRTTANNPASGQSRDDAIAQSLLSPLVKALEGEAGDAAAKALAIIGRAALPAVKEALASRSQGVVESAIQIVMEMELSADERASMLSPCLNGKAAHTAIGALRDCGHEGLATLINYLARAPHWTSKMAAIEAIAKFQRTEDASLFKHELKDDSNTSDVRVTALRALRLAGDTDVELRAKKLNGLLGESFGFVDSYEEACDELVHLGDKAVIAVDGILTALATRSANANEALFKAIKAAGAHLSPRSADLIEALRKNRSTFRADPEAFGFDEVPGLMDEAEAALAGEQNSKGAIQEIEAEVPMAEVLDYGNVLSSLTQGRGMYTMSIASYREVPAQLQERVVAARNNGSGKEKAAK